MASGRQGSISIGKETTWGTAVPPTAFYNGTEGIQETRERLRESMTFGSRALQPGDAGRLRIAGPVSGMHARPVGIGHWLRAALGAPVTVGTGAPYTHTFVPASTKFSTEAALPPLSATVKRSASVIHRYAGCQVNRLTLAQPKDDALSMDVDLIAKSVASTTDTTIVTEAGPRFRFQQLEVKRATSVFPYLESFELAINNNLETEETLNETDQISAVDFGNSEISLALTATFRDALSYANFTANTTEAWTFEWTIAAGTKLKVSIPRLNIESWSAPISGPGRMTVSMSGQAEHDSVAGHGLQIVLTNDQATY